MMIAIDGPAGAGKSEISRGLAAKLGFAYLDTGAMYRAIGLKAMRLGAPLDEESSLAAILDNTALEVHCSVNGAPVILLDGENVTETLRRQDVGDAASHVSALPVVRAWLLDKQRALAASGNVIMDGRDIGTQVLPNAEVKIYLTASPKVRAQRRVDQLKEKGQKCRLRRGAARGMRARRARHEPRDKPAQARGRRASGGFERHDHPGSCGCNNEVRESSGGEGR